MAPFPEGLLDVAHGDKDTFDGVWKVVQECGEEERHFNQLQGIYRGLASTWILATLGAVGYLLFNKDMTSVPRFQLYFVAAVVCGVGAAGVALIWILDLKVYHRLLVAVFEEGLELEDKVEWLPRFRKNMVALKGDPVRKRLAYYYVGTMGVPLIASCCFFGLFLRDLNVSWHRWLAGLLIVAFGVLLLLFRNITKSRESLTGEKIRSSAKQLTQMHGAAPVRVQDESGLHITVGSKTYVLFSDTSSKHIHLGTVSEDKDFEWSKDCGDFTTRAGQKLRPTIAGLVI